MPVLAEPKKTILEKWVERTLATYPSQTLRFFESEKDRFRNPVGHTLREGLARLLDQITGEMDLDQVRPALESIVRLRAVQDFTPSQAVGFVYLLRVILDEDERSAAILAAQGHGGGFTPPWRGKPAAMSAGRDEPAATPAGRDEHAATGRLEAGVTISLLHRRIDELALLAFDLYMKCREEIDEIKAREAQRKVYVLDRMSQRG
jgi:hypothetical protein